MRKKDENMLDSDFEALLRTCRIRLSAEEAAALRKEAEELISYFNSLDSVDTEGIAPAYHPIAVEQKTRADEIKEFGDIGGLLGNSKTYRFYVVGPEV